MESWFVRVAMIFHMFLSWWFFQVPMTDSQIPIPCGVSVTGHQPVRAPAASWSNECGDIIHIVPTVAVPVYTITNSTGFQFPLLPAQYAPLLASANMVADQVLIPGTVHEKGGMSVNRRFPWTAKNWAAPRGPRPKEHDWISTEIRCLLAKW